MKPNQSKISDGRKQKSQARLRSSDGLACGTPIVDADAEEAMTDCGDAMVIDAEIARSLEREKSFYRHLLTQIASDPRKTRARRLAEHRFYEGELFALANVLQLLPSEPDEQALARNRERSAMSEDCKACAGEVDNHSQFCPLANAEAASSLAAPSGYAADAAKKAVRAVINELKGRKGFGWWWDDIGQYQQDIIECAEREVEKVLKPHTSKLRDGATERGPSSQET